MSCQTYLQWWISPWAHLLLKTDHLVSLHRSFFFPPCSLNSSTSTLFSLFLCLGALYLSFALAVLLLPCRDFSLYLLSLRFSLQFSVPFSHLQSWMTHVYDPCEGTHLFSAHPMLSVSLLLVFSPLCSTCLHTSAASPLQTVFCPFNILHRWKGHRKLQYPLNPL